MLKLREYVEHCHFDVSCNAADEQRAVIDGVCVTINRPDVAAEAIRDVVGLRALKNAWLILSHRPGPVDTANFDRALAKMININGGVARVVENGVRRSKRSGSRLAKQAS